MIQMYLYVRIDNEIETMILKQKRKQHALPGDDASTAVGRGEVQRANSTPNGGPHLELARIRLKTWGKSDFLDCPHNTSLIIIHVFIYTWYLARPHPPLLLTCYSLRLPLRLELPIGLPLLQLGLRCLVRHLLPGRGE